MGVTEMEAHGGPKHHVNGSFLLFEVCQPTFRFPPFADEDVGEK